MNLVGAIYYNRSLRSILLVVEGIKDEEIDSICVLKLSSLKQEFYPYLKLDLLF
jgi:hypothetical protein